MRVVLGNSSVSFLAHHPWESARQSGNGTSALRAASFDLQPSGGTHDDQNGPQ